MLFQEIAQGPLGNEITFEKVVEVLKKTQGNANLAKELLNQMSQSSLLAASSQFQNMTLQTGDDDEDIYS